MPERIAPYGLLNNLARASISPEHLTEEEYIHRVAGAREMLSALLRVSGGSGFEIPPWPPEHIEPFTDDERRFGALLTEVIERSDNNG